MVDCAYSLADEVGEIGVEGLEKTLQDFNAKCSRQLAQRDAPVNNKRKYVPMTQTKHRGGTKRMYNTHHMPK